MPWASACLVSKYLSSGAVGHGQRYEGVHLATVLQPLNPQPLDVA